MEKRCFKCLCIKPLHLFYAHKMMKDGHLNKCKECTKSDVMKHREANYEKVNAYDRERSKNPERKAKFDERHKRWVTENPHKIKAQVALSNAVRDRRIFRWPICFVPECNRKPEAHHPDYSRPLDVVWLCRSHHRKAHLIK